MLATILFSVPFLHAIRQAKVIPFTSQLLSAGLCDLPSAVCNLMARVLQGIEIKTDAGESPLPGLTDEEKPRLRGPKRANKIRKLFNLSKEDDVRK